MAGGVACTNTQFIRAAHTTLSALGKSAQHREWRHKWLRDGLNYLDNSRAEYGAIYRDTNYQGVQS